MHGVPKLIDELVGNEPSLFNGNRLVCTAVYLVYCPESSSEIPLDALYRSGDSMTRVIPSIYRLATD